MRILILSVLILVSVSTFGLDNKVAEMPYEPTFSEWVGGWAYDLGVWATLNLLPDYGVAGSDPQVVEGETHYIIYIVHNPDQAAANVANYSMGVMQEIIEDRVEYWQNRGYPIETSDFIFQLIPQE